MSGLGPSREVYAFSGSSLYSGLSTAINKEPFANKTSVAEWRRPSTPAATARPPANTATRPPVNQPTVSPGVYDSPYTVSTSGGRRDNRSEECLNQLKNILHASCNDDKATILEKVVEDIEATIKKTREECKDKLLKLRETDGTEACSKCDDASSQRIAQQQMCDLRQRLQVSLELLGSLERRFGEIIIRPSAERIIYSRPVGVIYRFRQTKTADLRCFQRETEMEFNCTMDSIRSQLADDAATINYLRCNSCQLDEQVECLRKTNFDLESQLCTMKVENCELKDTVERLKCLRRPTASDSPWTAESRRSTDCPPARPTTPCVPPADSIEDLIRRSQTLRRY